MVLHFNLLLKHFVQSTAVSDSFMTAVILQNCVPNVCNFSLKKSAAVSTKCCTLSHRCGDSLTSICMVYKYFRRVRLMYLVYGEVSKHIRELVSSSFLV